MILQVVGSESKRCVVWYEYVLYAPCPTYPTEGKEEYVRGMLGIRIVTTLTVLPSWKAIGARTLTTITPLFALA